MHVLDQVTHENRPEQIPFLMTPLVLTFSLLSQSV